VNARGPHGSIQASAHGGLSSRGCAAR